MAKKEERAVALSYRFGPDGSLASVEFAGELTPEVHAQIKEAVLRAREIAKGRS